MRCTDCGRDLTRLALVSEHRGWCPRRFAHTPGHAALLQAAWDDGTVMTSDGLMPRRVHVVALAVRDLFAAIRAWCEREAPPPWIGVVCLTCPGGYGAWREWVSNHRALVPPACCDAPMEDVGIRGATASEAANRARDWQDERAARSRRPAAEAPAPVAEADARSLAVEWWGRVYCHASATRVDAGWCFVPDRDWVPIVVSDAEVRAYQARRRGPN